MRRVEICVHREQSAPLSAAHLLFLLSGIWSLLLFLSGAPPFDFPIWPVLLCGGLSGFVLWLLGRKNWNASVRAMLIFIAAWLICFFFLRGVIRGQIAACMIAFFGGQTAPVKFTETACMLAALISWMIFTLEYALESHLIPWLATTAAALAGPSIGIRPTVESIVMAFIFQISFWTMHEAGLRQSRSDFPLRNRSRVTSMAAFSVTGLLAAACLIAAPLASRDSDKIYEPVYRLESAVHSVLARITGRVARSDSEGIINRGNRVPVGAVQLILKSDKSPTQPVYLRGFSGGDYTGGAWERADDDAIFYHIAENLNNNLNYYSGFRENYNHIPEEILNLKRRVAGTFYTMYFGLNAQIQDAPEPISLWISHTDGHYRNLYAPYYGWRDSSYDGEGYLCQFYEQNDMRIDWNSTPEIFNFDWFRQVRDSYIKEIQDQYTRVPEEILPRLNALCREFLNNNKNNTITPEEVTAFVLYTLQSKAEYSLTPGWIPWNQEPVEYFLFENGRGYCQHFAAAACLIYRLCGVPARYATGYVAWPEQFQTFLDFQEVQDFNSGLIPPRDYHDIFDATPDDFTPRVYQRAVLTDASAHAWVEIFLPDYGWTPVEVTPSSDGTIPASWPGLDGDAVRDFLTALRKSAPRLSRSAQNNNLSGASDSLILSFFTRFNRADLKKYFTRAGLVILILCPVCACLFYYLRRERRKHASCRAVFGGLLSMLRFAGFSGFYHSNFNKSNKFNNLNKFNNFDEFQEEDFPEKLSQIIPEINLSDSRRFFETVQMAAYGSPESLTDEQKQNNDAFARRIYDRAARSVASGIRPRWWKRPLFQYLFL